MSAKLSLLILGGTVVVIGILFFQVIRPFFFPLFFAGILAVLFKPLYRWTTQRCFGRKRIAAAIVTVAVIAMVLLPLGAILALAGTQLFDAGQDIVNSIDLPENSSQAKALVDPEQFPALEDEISWARGQLDDKTVDQIRSATSKALLGVTKTIYERTSGLVGDAISFVVGLMIMIFALYYFFADGDKMMAEVQRLSPLETEDEHSLFEQFENVCRSVVLGTVVSAIVQGVLAAIGFAIAGVDRVWLLAVCTMLFSFIPFLGAASVWIVVTIGLFFEQRYGAGLGVALYGAVVISGSDNLIKAHVIHGQAQMHPLIAMVTVMGALQLVGLWGIFLGPICAAFFYAFIKILRKRLMQTSESASE